MVDSLRIDRIVPAPPDRVWTALTEPSALAAWFWPPAFDTKVEADPRPGGLYRIESAARGLAVAGSYVTVDPPRRLVFTWRWAGEDDDTLVTIELSPVDNGTALTLTHERFADPQARTNHAIGWSDCLDRLPALLGPTP